MVLTSVKRQCRFTSATRSMSSWIRHTVSELFVRYTKPTVHWTTTVSTKIYKIGNFQFQAYKITWSQQIMQSELRTTPLNLEDKHAILKAQILRANFSLTRVKLLLRISFLRGQRELLSTSRDNGLDDYKMSQDSFRFSPTICTLPYHSRLKWSLAWVVFPRFAFSCCKDYFSSSTSDARTETFTKLFQTWWYLVPDLENLRTAHFNSFQLVENKHWTSHEAFCQSWHFFPSERSVPTSNPILQILFELEFKSQTQGHSSRIKRVENSTIKITRFKLQKQSECPGFLARWTCLGSINDKIHPQHFFSTHAEAKSPNFETNLVQLRTWNFIRTHKRTWTGKYNFHCINISNAFQQNLSLQTSNVFTVHWCELLAQCWQRLRTGFSTNYRNTRYKNDETHRRYWHSYSVNFTSKHPIKNSLWHTAAQSLPFGLST